MSSVVASCGCAGSGFGLRTAELFAEEGAAIVYLVDRRQDRLDSAAAAISARSESRGPANARFGRARPASGPRGGA